MSWIPRDSHSINFDAIEALALSFNSGISKQNKLYSVSFKRLYDAPDFDGLFLDVEADDVLAALSHKIRREFGRSALAYDMFKREYMVALM